jgi:hypothetical protein
MIQSLFKIKIFWSIVVLKNFIQENYSVPFHVEKIKKVTGG